MAECKRRLKKIDVDFISLVGKGANGKSIVYKSANSVTPNLNKQFNIIKTDEEKHLVYGTVYEPETVDSQGDIADAEVIEKAAHDFLASLKNTNVDTQHDFTADDGAVVESFILRSADPLYPETLPGAWVVAIKVAKDNVWESIKKGEIGGLSLAGLAQVEQVEKAETPSIWNKIKSFFVTKDFNSRLKAREMMNYVDALSSSNWDIMYDDENGKSTLEDKKAAILENVAQFVTAFSAADFSSTTTAKSDNSNQNKNNGDVDMTAEELKKTIDEALKPVTERLDTLEKSQKEESEKVEKANKEKIEALEKQNKELTERLEVVEKATPGSSQIKKENSQNKEVSIWL